jgi:protein-arginine kinase activator protein McsA
MQSILHLFVRLLFKIMNCEIDFCKQIATSTLTIDVENGDKIELFFCKACASHINQNMMQSLGDRYGALDLYKGNIPYNIGDLQSAINKLEHHKGNECGAGVERR